MESAADVFLLEDWACFSFTGPDRKAFLNGLLTNDVAKLPPGQGFAVCLLTPKGLLRAYFLLYDVGSSLLALCPQAGAANLKAAVEKVIMLGETKCEDWTATKSVLLIAGEKTSAVVSEVFKTAVPKNFACGQVGPIWLGSWPRFQKDAVFAVVPKAAADQTLESVERAGAQSADAEAFETRRIEAGIALFGRDAGEDAMPLEARMDDAISYTKGCYMGQETISRIHHMGHVNRILVKLRIAGQERPDCPADIFSSEGNEPIGRMTSYCRSAALAMVTVAHSAPGSLLRLRGQDKDLEASVIEF